MNAPKLLLRGIRQIAFFDHTVKRSAVNLPESLDMRSRFGVNDR